MSRYRLSPEFAVSTGYEPVDHIFAVQRRNCAGTPLNEIFSFYTSQRDSLHWVMALSGRDGMTQQESERALLGSKLTLTPDGVYKYIDAVTVARLDSPYVKKVPDFLLADLGRSPLDKSDQVFAVMLERRTSCSPDKMTGMDTLTVGIVSGVKESSTVRFDLLTYEAYDIYNDDRPLNTSCTYSYAMTDSDNLNAQGNRNTRHPLVMRDMNSIIEHLTIVARELELGPSSPF
jgi:hypothetical protein